jgi:nanoRNase/pAp phosphatase (c-di-AMP/oligoRNAs hydrolase)
MRPVLICSEVMLPIVLGSATVPGVRPTYAVGRAMLRTRIARRGARVVQGDVDDPAFLRKLVRTGRGAVVIVAPTADIPAVGLALAEAAPESPVAVLGAEERAVPGAVVVSPGAFGERVVQPALERAAQRLRAERVREHFASAERVLILMQDDPDPDAIASALALKTLLARTRASARLCTFGAITRTENVAMCRILDIDVEEIRAPALDQFDRIAMVDVQPTFLEERLNVMERFPEVDLVIDHHPVERPIRARIRDVRPSYGATATILVEYLVALDVKISQRLATALLYGIKSDTLALERGSTRADLSAYAYLFGLANHSALRRIERPALSEAALDALAVGLRYRRVARGVFFSHLGEIETVDPVPQFADFGLSAEGVEWSVVSGVFDGEVHVSVRNVGYVKSAGDITRAAFGDLGSAGGHRTMAKAVVPMRAVLADAPDASTAEARHEWVIRRFLRALEQNGRA